MFEQAILENGDPRKRVWTTCAGVTSQMLLITAAALVPLIWPQALPKLQTLVGVLTVPPSPPPPVHVDLVRTENMRIPTQAVGKALPLPSHIPDQPMPIEDPPEAFGAIGVTGAIESGLPPGVVALGLLSEVLNSVRAVAPPRLPEPAKPATTPDPASITRVRVGGVVSMATLLHRVDPQYPVLAKQARVFGVVELEGVIGTDGRMRELVVKVGHPLLVRAALDAVRQWIYKPTYLNGTPVEVIAPITVTFHLN